MSQNQRVSRGSPKRIPVARTRESAARTNPRWLAAECERLRDFAADGTPRRLVDYWDQGYRAARLLDQCERRHVPMTARKLAARIGVPNDASLRLAIKFAGRATRRQAIALQNAQVRWFGVLYWLGVQNPRQFRELYDKMRSGVRTARQIREYIAAHFDKPVQPRIVPDPIRMVQKTCQEIVLCTATLAGLVDVWERAKSSHTGDPARINRRKRRILASQLGELKKQIRRVEAKVAMWL